MLSDQTVIQAEPVNTVFRNRGTDMICHSLQRFHGVAHGHAGANSFKHFHIILPVAEGHGLGGIQMKMLQDLPDGAAFSAGFGNHIGSPFPGNRQLHLAGAPEQGTVFRFPAGSHVPGL